MRPPTRPGTINLGTSCVDIIKPGDYQDMFALGPEYEPNPGRVKRFRSPQPGFVAGTIEASDEAFFLTGKRWVHLWLSD